MPTTDEIKEQLKTLKKTHPEIRYGGLKKPELVELLKKYTTVKAPAPAPVAKAPAPVVKAPAPSAKPASAPTIKSNFSKEEYERVRDELDTSIMDVHDYSLIGIAYPLDESRFSIIPKYTERSQQLYYNYMNEDSRLTDKISKYLKKVIEWVKSNSVKTKTGIAVITQKKHEELFK